MAASYDTSAVAFEVSSLRSLDAVNLGGVVAAGALPTPIALAEGPSSLDGPAGAVGANEMWVLEVPVPEQMCAWVMISSDYSIRTKTGVGAPVSSYVYVPGGDTYWQGPAQGLGANLNVNPSVIAAGTYVDAVQADDPSWTHTTWYPINPSGTVTGFSVVFHNQAPAGGYAIDDLRIRADEVRFLGFPISAWDTGALWGAAALRGV